MNKSQNTVPVSDETFRQVYDSLSSLPTRDRWLTRDADVRKNEELLGMGSDSVGASL